MARAIGLRLSTGMVFLGNKSAVLLSPAVKKSSTPAWFSGKSAGGRVVACAASTTKKARGIMLPQRISPALQDLLGVPEISRAQAIKLIWEYIKTNNLQDPNNKKIIVCDEKLQKVFGKDRVGMLEVSGLISPHLLKSEN